MGEKRKEITTPGAEAPHPGADSEGPVGPVRVRVTLTVNWWTGEKPILRVRGEGEIVSDLADILASALDGVAVAAMTDAPGFDFRGGGRWDAGEAYVDVPSILRLARRYGSLFIDLGSDTEKPHPADHLIKYRDGLFFDLWVPTPAGWVKAEEALEVEVEAGEGSE